MVVDPFSALGVAGNIVQFLDFGSKLVSKGKEIYTSADGSSVTNVELEFISQDLHSIADSLSPNSSPSSSQNSNLGDDEMRRLATSCKAVAEELLGVVRDLKVEENCKHRKWKSFRQALKSVWKDGDIQSLQDRIDGFRRQLTIRLITILG
jgi:hypothetical protein